MGSGTMIFGSDAFVAGISGSDEVGPTCAGATELAVAAAKISKADRNESNI